MVSLSKLVRVLGGQTVGAHPGGIELSDVRLDSRLGGAGILFAALPGTRTDGAAFAADALAAGSPAVLSPLLRRSMMRSRDSLASALRMRVWLLKSMGLVLQRAIGES